VLGVERMIIAAQAFENLFGGWDAKADDAIVGNQAALGLVTKRARILPVRPSPLFISTQFPSHKPLSVLGRKPETFGVINHESP
jgi:hypothetical protein